VQAKTSIFSAFYPEILFADSFDAGKILSLDIFKHGSTTGRNIADLIGQFILVYSS
jgi:hypothetical protein